MLLPISVNLRINFKLNASKPNQHRPLIVGTGLCARPLFEDIRHGGAQRPRPTMGDSNFFLKLTLMGFVPLPDGRKNGPKIIRNGISCADVGKKWTVGVGNLRNLMTGGAEGPRPTMWEGFLP